MPSPSDARSPSALAQDDETLAALITPPRVAWPTLALFALSLCLYASATALALAGQLAPVWAVLVNTLAAYWLFTVFHDAAHRALGHSLQLNDWVGRISTLALFPFPIFKAFRFIHMQHHRFANESDGRDPDAYTGEGPALLLPLRWATVDFNYYRFYLAHWRQRPLAERRETLLALAFGVLACGGLILAGAGQALLLYWLLPGRLAIAVLAFAFDYLPHHPRKSTQQENPWQATNNRVGLEWLLTPVLMWQNYHLIHHLYPRVPCYRYLKVWRQGEPLFRRQQPLLVDVLGRELAGTELAGPAARQGEKPAH
ncbi:MAG: fatty acid desaturase [Marinobacter sp.]|uniref:fatty acid desaturase n=1 Tax=Marinobacter sp. TaxID=50741 RepID=UPI00299E78F4|nr:fatty acid desaturase [Marinobacter sp.]MDX1634244.1 fatty acid desaturase [Marinobacter sp.]